MDGRRRNELMDDDAMPAENNKNCMCAPTEKQFRVFSATPRCLRLCAAYA